MRDIILKYFNKIDFDIMENDLEPFIQYALHHYYNVEPKYEEGFKPPYYFKTLIFLMDKELQID